MEGDTRIRAGFAGLIAVAVALGLGELLAGLFDAVPSPLASVGGLVVDSSPPFLKDFAIAVFGTADKAALALGTTVIALILGWQLGLRSRNRSWLGPLVFGLFAVLGVAAAWNEAFAEPVPVIAATAVTATAGWLALVILLGTAEPEQPTDGLAGDASKRRFIWLAAGTSAAAVVAGATGRALLTRVRELPEIDLTTEAPVIPTELTPFEFDVPGISPIVVPNEDFYRIDTALIVPTIDEQDWSLRVHGMVDREITLGYDELLAMERVEDYVTIACVSNEVGGSLVGNALWSGVRLTDVLDMAGVDPAAGQLVARSVDGFTAGFPPQLAYDGREPLVALGMNGDPLPREHGFPARLIVPGLYGYVSATKWLAELELTTWDGFDAYWIPRGWAKEAPIKTQSRIDTPDPRRVHDPGAAVLGGVAWAPLKGIERVEVRIDGGEWLEAEVSAPLSDRSWVQWRRPADFTTGSYVVEVRATDGEGITQPEERKSPRPDGATGYHTITHRVG